ncbi:outer membrane lipoprotein carrier protein LolA [bacterium]|nr:outer membrane lipoprotein carrier protein LolA [bacterium]
MNAHRPVIITLFTVMIFSFVASAITPGSALRKVRKKYHKVVSMQAEFREVFEWEMTGESSIRSGSLVVTADNRFRFNTPEQLLISDGENIFRYNRVKKQVIIEPVGENSDQLLPQKLLLDFADGFKAVSLSPLTVDGREGFRLDMTAEDPETTLLSSATLWVTSDDLVVHRLKLLDLNSNSTTYYLSNIIFDQPIDTSVTAFTPPEGVELFDLR